MNQSKSYQLLSRQLQDILASAERILNGKHSPEQVEAFSNYSKELKKYIEHRIDDEELKMAADMIEDINYKQNSVDLWMYLIAPVALIRYYKDYKKREEIRQSIQDIRGQYSSLLLMVNARLN